MRQLITAFAVTFLTIFHLSASDLPHVSSSINRVTLYPSGAAVYRSTDVQLSSGYNKIVLTGIPAHIDPSTLSLSTTNRVMLLSQKTKRDYSAKRELSELQHQKKHLQDTIQWLEIEKKVLNDQNDLLHSNRKLPEETTNYSVEQLNQLHEYYGKQRITNEKAIYKLSHVLRTKQEELQQLQNQINGSRKNGGHGETHIVLELQAPRAASTKIGLEYIDPNAGWTPTYDIRVADLNKPLSLVYKASIYQNTGEEWNDVALSLSTAEPNRYYATPSLPPYYLKEYIELRAMGYAPSMNKKATMSADADGAAEYQEETEMSQSIPPSTSSSQTTLVEYQLDRPYSITSSSNRSTVLLQRKELKADYEYIAVPKVLSYAVLTAKIKDWESLNLINGQANIYLENRYVGKTYLQNNITTPEYELSLGKDDRVKVSRELVRGYEKTRFLGSNKVDTREYKLTVHNLKSTPISIQIIDQYPVSQDSDIKVSLKKDGDAQINKDKGELKWNTDIAPAAKWSKTIKYEIKYPKSKSITIEE